MTARNETAGPSAFGKYQLERRLAVGGMAEIFLAHVRGVEGFAKPVVVKRILPHLRSEPEFLSMFIDEAKLAATLTHPNIVQVHELGVINGDYYIVMEYVPGTDVRTLGLSLERLNERWPPGVVFSVVAEAARGLHYAHEKRTEEGTPLNLVHRDVSPQNILLSNEGLVKITDFGIAKAAGRSTHTRTGVLKGKFSYMAPEQSVGCAVDKRSDLFALGIVAFELFSNRRAYNGESDLETLEMARQAELPSLTVYGVPRAVAGVVARALAKNPAERYETCAQFAAALLEAARDWAPAADSDEVAALVRRALPQQESTATAALAPASTNSAPDERRTREGGRRRLQSKRPGSGPHTAIITDFDEEESTTRESRRVEAKSAVGSNLWPDSELARTREDRAEVTRSVHLPSAPHLMFVALMGAIISVTLIGTVWALRARSSRAPPPQLTDSSRSFGTQAEQAVGVRPAGPAVPSTTSLGAGAAPEGSGGAPSAGTPSTALAESPGSASPDPPTTVVSPQASGPGTSVAGGGVAGGGVAGSGVAGSGVSQGTAASAEPAAGGDEAPGEADAKPRRTPPGYLTLNSSPWSYVFIDGKKLAKTTPLQRYSVPAGKHRVRFESPGAGRSEEFTVEVRPGKTTTKIVSFGK